MSQDVFHEKTGWKKTLLIGFQHLLTMCPGTIAVPLILASALNFSAEETAFLVSANFLTSGVAVSYTHLDVYKRQGCGAAVIAYFLFSHVRQRVVAWKNPFSVYQNEGYQIVQGLFAIGTGGWFGMGLCQGSPEMIPFVKQDYMFAAICEELGGLFAICMILICMSMFLLVVNISLRIKKRFYKLIALGLGTEYAFQVFLTIGGVTKFIPMTGITLPLVSYGGSSVLSTIIMLAIIQGLYILREDEDEMCIRDRLCFCTDSRNRIRCCERSEKSQK